MIKVRLTKISSSHDNLRTDEIIGETANMPTIDKDFIMFSSGLEFGTRMIQTTNVKRVLFLDDVIQFKTENSLYAIEIIKEGLC